MSKLAPLLLDTCAAIWISEGVSLSASATVVLERVYDEKTPVFVSPITAWEIGILARRLRVSLLMSPHSWYQRLFDLLGLQPAAMPGEVLINSSYLPGAPPNDPADRILAATAREYGFTLVTRDRPLLDYAEQGHIHALPC